MKLNNVFFSAAVFLASTKSAHADTPPSLLSFLLESTTKGFAGLCETIDASNIAVESDEGTTMFSRLDYMTDEYKALMEQACGMLETFISGTTEVRKLGEDAAPAVIVDKPVEIVAPAKANHMRKRGRRRAATRGASTTTNRPFDNTENHGHRNLSSKKKQKKCKGKAKDDDEKFNIFVATGLSALIGFPDFVSLFDGFSQYSNAGQTAGLTDIVIGLVLTFDEEIDPFEIPFDLGSLPTDGGDIIEFFGDLFAFLFELLEGISKIEFMIGTLGGTLTDINDLILQAYYTDYGLDFLTIDLGLLFGIQELGECDTIFNINQIRAAGSVLGIDVNALDFSVPEFGLTPITTSSLGMAGSVNGGEIAMVFEDDQGWSYEICTRRGCRTFEFCGDCEPDILIAMVGFVPFTQEAAWNFNDQVNEFIDFLIPF